MSSTTRNDGDTQTLDILLKKTQDPVSSSALLPDELSYLITAFLPSQPITLRSKGYLVLSAYCQGVRHSYSVKGKQPDPATESLVNVFAPLIISRLADSDDVLLVGISFLTALFQVDWESASSIFLQDGVIDFVMDSVDLTPSAQLSLHVAHLLGQASGNKPCRAIISSQSVQWLESNSRQTNDSALRAAAAIALVKLSRGSAADDIDSTGSEGQTGKGNDEELAKVMKGMIISGSNLSSTTDAIEGLAYLSVDPVVKEALSKDSMFLSRLFALVPRRKVVPSLNSAEVNSALLYGIFVIISNICAYRPRFTEEQVQVEKLRRMAKAGKSPAQDSSALESDEDVKERVRRLVSCGVLDVFAAVPGIESLGIRVNAGKALLSIIEDNGNRGRVLQSGGAKVLMLIIKHATSVSSSGSAKPPVLDVTHLQPIQALAKLAITSSPVQVFGPNEGAAYDAIRPLSIMLLHPSSTLLQRFEALMALTNLSSRSPETASCVAKADGMMNKVELLLLEEHPLIRRASMELICNLIAGSDEVFERYGGTENPSGSKSKLQVLLALSDVDDLPTRLAASGALATLTAAPSACHALISLQLERRRVLPILAQLIDPSTSHVEGDTEERDNEGGHHGLVHRGIVCARNFLINIVDEATQRGISKDAEEAGLVRALVNVVKAQPESGRVDESILRPAAEALKFLTNKKD